MALLNSARMSVSGTPGTGTITLNAAIAKYLTFAEAGAVNATQYSYRIEENNDFEIGVGTYTSSGTTFSRDTVTVSKISGTAGTSKMNLTSAAEISIVARAQDLPYVVLDKGYAEYLTYTNLSTTIPLDDTIPTSSEGTSILSVSITPKSATSRLRATFVGNGGCSSSGNTLIAALFDGTTCKDVCWHYQSASETGGTLGMCVEWVPGDTNSHTITVRVGASAANGFMNGYFTARLFGGVARTTLVVEELAA